MAVLSYIKARLAERMTWLSIGVAITGAAALSWPWDVAFVAVGVIGSIVPSPGNGGTRDE